MSQSPQILFIIALVALSALATAVLIRLMQPLLARYALARPNARSSHLVPTPQGGGLPIVMVATVVMLCLAALDWPQFRQPWLWSVLASVVGLAVIGAVDDLRPLPVVPRLILQVGVASLLVATLPLSTRIVPWVPSAIENAVLVVGLVWFINLTNFMDGIDWMLVVEVIPICLLLIIFGMTDLVPQISVMMPIVAVMLGGVFGFAPFNRHAAKLFMGDVGSLPIGAVLGWLMILLACAGHWAAALILPLYFLADATFTLGRRYVSGERVSQAHRTHFYQIATQRGYTVPQVTARVFALNLALGGLALVAVAVPLLAVDGLCLAVAMAITCALLWSFERGCAR